MAVAGSSQPSMGFQRKVDGMPPMCWGLKTWTRAEVRAHRAGQGVDVGFGGGGDDRAGVLDDHVGQERGLVGPGRGHNQQVLFERDAQLMPVVGAAEEDRVLARVDQPVAQWEGGADLAGAAQDREAGPAQPQAEDVGEAFAGVQAQVQTDAQVAGAVAGQVPGGQERPGEDDGQDQDDGQEDGVLDHHRGSPFRRPGRPCAGPSGRHRR
jgi:hypothetical protein